jgi:hypothetical protein
MSVPLDLWNAATHCERCASLMRLSGIPISNITEVPQIIDPVTANN